MIGEGAPAARVLVVDDSERIAMALRYALSGRGHKVQVAGDGAQALAAFRAFEPDIAILDLGLPDMDGLDVLATVRAGGSPIPIIVLTVRDEVDDRVLGLRGGADDYMTKPFAMDELLARVDVALRRHPPKGHNRLSAGNVVLSHDERRVLIADKELELTGREFELLEYLLRNVGLAVTKATLLEAVWDYPPDAITKTVEVTTGKLRRKLADAGASVQLETLRGVGFRLVEGQSAA